MTQKTKADYNANFEDFNNWALKHGWLLVIKRPAYLYREDNTPDDNRYLFATPAGQRFSVSVDDKGLIRSMNF